MSQGTQRAREKMVHEIQRTRLGGIERIGLDRLPNESWQRYAHIYDLHGCSVTLHTTDDPDTPDEAYQGKKGFTLVGVIDLDTGDLAREPRRPETKPALPSPAAEMVENGEVPF